MWHTHNTQGNEVYTAWRRGHGPQMSRIPSLNMTVFLEPTKILDVLTQRKVHDFTFLILHELSKFLHFGGLKSDHKLS